MAITVVDTNGKVHHPRPKSNPFVAPYLRPYEIIRDRSKISSVLNESLISSGWQSVAGIDVGKAVLRVATEEEIDAALNILNNVDYILACTSTYPTKDEEINLNYITTLNKTHSF